MPIPAHISKFLDSQHVTYQCCTHSRAYTAQGTAQAQHLSGKKLAKVVIVVADNKKFIMAVVPASYRVDPNQSHHIDPHHVPTFWKFMD